MSRFERARQEFPPWAFLDGIRKVEDEPEKKDKVFFPAWFDRFKRNHTILIACVLFLTIWTAATCMITGSIVRHNTELEVTERVTHDLRASMQAYIDQQEQERIANNLLSGDASRQAAIKTDAEAMARAFEGIKGITEREDDLRTYGWNICFRASHKDFPSTIVGVVSQKNQYMGYSDQNPVVSKKYDIALEVVTDYYNGNWPETDRYVYAEWENSGKIILRDEYNSGRSTSYWWWGK